MEYGRLTFYFVLIFITEASRGAVIPTSLHPRQGELQLTRNIGTPLSMTRKKREEPRLAILLPVPPETTEACNEDHDHYEESAERKQLDTLSTDESNSVHQKHGWTVSKLPGSIHDTDSSPNDNDISADNTLNGCKPQTVQTLIDQVQNNNRINLFQQLMNAEVLDNILILRNPFRKGCTKRCVKDKDAKDQNLRKDNKFANIKKSNDKPIGKSRQSCKSKTRHRCQSSTTENETTDSELELNKGEVQNTEEITNYHKDKINYYVHSTFKDGNQVEKKVTGLGQENSTQISNNNGDTRNLQKPSESISGQWDVVETPKLNGETQDNTIDYNEGNTMNHTVLQSGNQDGTQNAIISHKEEVTPSSEKKTENSNKSPAELLEKTIADNDIHKMFTEKQQPQSTNTDVGNAYNDFLNNLAAEPNLDMDHIEELMNPKYDKTYSSQDENGQTLPGYNREEFRDSAYSEKTKKSNETDENLIQKLVTETPIEKVNNIKFPGINIKNQTTAGDKNLVHDDLEKNLIGKQKPLSSYPDKNNSYYDYFQSGDSVSDSLEELTNKKHTKFNGSQKVYTVISPDNDTIRDFSTESTLVTDNTLELKTNTEAHTPELEKPDTLSNIHDKLYVTNQHFTQSPDTHSGEEDSEITPIIKYEHDSEIPDSLTSEYKGYETSQETNTEEVYESKPTKAYTPQPEGSKSLASTHEKENAESQKSTLSLDTNSKEEDTRNQSTKAYTPDSDTLASNHDNLYATSQNITHSPFTENRKKDSESEPTEKYIPNSKKPDSLASTYEKEYNKNQEATLSPNTDSKMWTLASIRDNVYATGREASHSSGMGGGEDVYGSEPTTEYEPNSEKPDSVASTHENEYDKNQEATLSPGTDIRTDDSESESTKVYTPVSEKSDTLTIIHNNKNSTSQEVSLSPVTDSGEKDYGSELTKAYEPDSEKPDTLVNIHDDVTNQVATLPPGTDSRVEDSRNGPMKKYSSSSEKPDTLDSNHDNEYAQSHETILSPGADSKEDDSGSELTKEYVPGSVTPDTLLSISDNMYGTNQEASLSLDTDKRVEDSKLVASPKDNKITKQITSEKRFGTDSSEEESGSEHKQAYTPDLEKLDTLANTHENEYVKNQEITLSPDTDSRKEDSENEPTQAYVPNAGNPDTLVSIQDNAHATSQDAIHSTDVKSRKEGSVSKNTNVYTPDTQKLDVMASMDENKNATSQNRTQSFGIDTSKEDSGHKPTTDYVLERTSQETNRTKEVYENDPTKGYIPESEKTDSLASIHENAYARSQEATLTPGTDTREEDSGNKPEKKYKPDTVKPGTLVSTHDYEYATSQEAKQSPDSDSMEEDSGIEPTKVYTSDLEKSDALASNHDNDNARSQDVSLSQDTDSKEEAYGSDPSIENEPNSQKPDSLVSTYENKNVNGQEATLFPDTDSREEDSGNEPTRAYEPDSEKQDTLARIHDNVYAISQEASDSSDMESREEAYGSGPITEYEPNSEKPYTVANTNENEYDKSQDAIQSSDSDRQEEDYGTDPTIEYEPDSEKPDVLASNYDNNNAKNQEISLPANADSREEAYVSDPTIENESDLKKPDSLISPHENEQSQETTLFSDTDSRVENFGNEPTKAYEPHSEKSDTLPNIHDNIYATNQEPSLSSSKNSREKAYGSKNESYSQNPDSLVSPHENEQSQEAILSPDTDSREENSGNEPTKPYEPDSEKSDTLLNIHNNVYATSQEASLSSSMDNREEAYGSEPTTEYEPNSEKPDSVASIHENEYAKNQEATLSPDTDNSEEESGSEPTKVYTPASENSDTPTTIHNNKNVTSQEVSLSPVTDSREKDSGSELTKAYEPDSKKTDTLASTNENEYVKSQEATLSPDTDSRDEDSGSEPTKVYEPDSENPDTLADIRDNDNNVRNQVATLSPGTNSKVEDSRNDPMKKYSSDSEKPDTLDDNHGNEYAKSHETILSPGADSKEDDSGSELTKEYMPGSVTPETLLSINDNMYHTNQEASLSLGTDKRAEDLKLMASPKDNKITKEIASENKSVNQDINPNTKTQLTSPDDEKLIHITQNKTVLNTTNVQETPLTRLLSWFKDNEPYNKGLQYFLGHHINGTENSTRLPELKEILSTHNLGAKDKTLIPDNSFPDFTGLITKTDKSKYGHFVGNICIPKNQQNISLTELLTGYFQLEKNNSNIILKKKQKATNCSSDLERCQVFIKNEENENILKNKRVLANSTAKIIKDTLVQSLANNDRENKNSQILPPSNFNASILQNDTSTDTATGEMETISNTESNNSMMAENENKKINAKRQIIMSMGKINNDIWHKRKRKDTEHSENETKKECLDTVLSALYHYYTAHNNTLGSAFLADSEKQSSYENPLTSTHSTEQETLSQNEYSSTEHSHYFNEKNSHYTNMKPASSQTEYSGDEHLYHSDEGNNFNGQNSRYRNRKPDPPSKRNTSQHIKKNCTRKNNMLQGQSSGSHLGNTHEDEIILPNNSLQIDRKLFEKFKTVYSVNNKTCKENKQDDNLEDISHKENIEDDDTLGDHRKFSTGPSQMKTLPERQTNGCISREPLQLTKYENYIGNRMDSIINILTSIRDFMVQN